MLCRDLGDGVLELQHGESRQRWLVSKRTIAPRVERLGMAIAETEVGLS